jgi:hypothetical protein
MCQVYCQSLQIVVHASCSICPFGLEAALQQRSNGSLKHAPASVDVLGPNQPLAKVSSAAVELHQTGHSCIAQHFWAVKGGRADGADGHCTCIMERPERRRLAGSRHLRSGKVAN